MKARNMQLIKEDMQELLKFVNTCLNSDTLCSVCINVVENIVELKRKLLPVQCKCSHVESPTEFPSNSSDLLTIKEIVPYNFTKEVEFAERESLRSLSRRADSEVEFINKSARKRRKRGSTHFTHRKRSQSANERSNRSLSRSKTTKKRAKSISDLPNVDDSSSDENNDSHKDQFQKRRSRNRRDSLTYDSQGRLQNKRTRSVSRLQEEEALAIRNDERSTYKCHECGETYEHVSILTHHKILFHNSLALFMCDECDERFTEKLHLREHMRIHDTSTFNCFMCGMEIQTSEKLQRHLMLHHMYTVPCVYCDKSFITKDMCDKHVKQCHKGKKQKIKYRPKEIIDRIDKLDFEEKPPERLTDVHFQIQFMEIKKRDNTNDVGEP